jgi:hypothetical protein
LRLPPAGPASDLTGIIFLKLSRIRYKCIKNGFQTPSLWGTYGTLTGGTYADNGGKGEPAQVIMTGGFP